MFCNFLNCEISKKSSRTTDILGCTFSQLKEHIEGQFEPGMTWLGKERKKWHMDHRIPVDSAANDYEANALNHYMNFQPLWAGENISKGNSYDPKEKEKYLEWYKENVII